jgi:hypothetical protein
LRRTVRKVSIWANVLGLYEGIAVTLSGLAVAWPTR